MLIYMNKHIYRTKEILSAIYSTVYLTRAHKGLVYIPIYCHILMTGAPMVSAYICRGTNSIKVNTLFIQPFIILYSYLYFTGVPMALAYICYLESNLSILTSSGISSYDYKYSDSCMHIGMFIMTPITTVAYIL